MRVTSGGGYTGTITLIGAESHQPYDRPPLSKALLKGDWEPERIQLRKPDEIDSLGLDLRLGTTATSLDAASRTVTLESGVIAADGVIIATGSAPRPLPNQPDLDGVMMLRTLDDSLALRRRLAEQPRVVVIGAGFIGLEVAATAAQSACAVTVLEGAPAPLIRGLGSEMGSVVARVHARNGVDVRCGISVSGIEGADGRVHGVRLGSGELVPADVVVVGIGVSPATEWLVGSGLEIRDGVVCSDVLRAAPGIYAAGDCARWVNNLFGDAGEEMRIEHWSNAAEQGAAAARNLLADLAGDAAIPYTPVPFFWSDQFDSRIQFVGRAHGEDEVHLVMGDLDGNFMAMYGHGGRLRGVLGVNMAKPVMRCRKLLGERASWEEAVTYAAAVAQ